MLLGWGTIVKHPSISLSNEAQTVSGLCVGGCLCGVALARGLSGKGRSQRVAELNLFGGLQHKGEATTTADTPFPMQLPVLVLCIQCFP